MSRGVAVRINTNKNAGSAWQFRIPPLVHRAHALFYAVREYGYPVPCGRSRVKCLPLAANKQVNMEKQNTARMAMTWKDRQRTRLPLVDLDDNPFCVERRTNEEWHMIQFNKAREKSKSLHM